MIWLRGGFQPTPGPMRGRSKVIGGRIRDAQAFLSGSDARASAKYESVAGICCGNLARHLIVSTSHATDTIVAIQPFRAGVTAASY